MKTHLMTATLIIFTLIWSMAAHALYSMNMDGPGFLAAIVAISCATAAALIYVDNNIG